MTFFKFLFFSIKLSFICMRICLLSLSLGMLFYLVLYKCSPPPQLLQTLKCVLWCKVTCKPVLVIYGQCQLFICSVDVADFVITTSSHLCCYCNSRVFLCVLSCPKILLSKPVLGDWVAMELLTKVPSAQNTLTASLQRNKTPPNKCPGYDAKQSDDEAPLMLEFWRMRSTPLLLLLLGPPWLGVVAPERVLSMGQKELVDI